MSQNSTFSNSLVMPNGPAMNRPEIGQKGDDRVLLTQILKETQETKLTVSALQDSITQLRHDFENKFQQLYQLISRSKGHVGASPLEQEEFSSLSRSLDLTGAAEGRKLTRHDGPYTSQEDDTGQFSMTNGGSLDLSYNENSSQTYRVVGHSETTQSVEIEKDKDDSLTLIPPAENAGPEVSPLQRPQVVQKSTEIQAQESGPSGIGSRPQKPVGSCVIINRNGFKAAKTSEGDDNRITFFNDGQGNDVAEETQQVQEEEEVRVTPKNEAEAAAPSYGIVRPMPRESESKSADSGETAVKAVVDKEEESVRGILRYSSETAEKEQVEATSGPVPLEKQHLEELTLKEAQRAAECTDPKSDGADTIICIDTSDSMMDAGIEDAKQFISDFLDGIEECAVEQALEENIAIVTFGKVTRVIQHLTNDYTKIRDVLDELEMGGPTPMMTGLVLCISAIYIRGGVVSYKNRKIAPRILLLSDGHASDARIMEGQDSYSPPGPSTEQTRKQLMEFAERLKNERRPVTCVPVGSNIEQTVMKRLAEVTGGQVLDLSGARKFSQHFFMNTVVARVFAEGNINATDYDRQSVERAVREQESTKDMDASEINDLVSMVMTELQNNPNAASNGADAGAEQGGPPPIGSRVRRGKDWIWDDQDDHMAGTITSHRQGNMVGVEWDSGRKGKFRYGAEGAYDLRVVDEPRYLGDGELTAVGVKCRRGPDWEWDNQDGGEGSLGTVFRIEDNGIIHVRWENGKRGNYRYGLQGKFDIMMCTEQDLFSGNTASQIPTSKEERLSEPVKMRAQWQWKNKNNEWIDHTEEATNKIEQLYTKRQRGTTLVHLNNSSYRVVIQNLNQRNTTTGDENQVRRIEVPDS